MEEYLTQYNAFATNLSNTLISWARPAGWGPSPTAVSSYIKYCSYIILIF